MKKKRFWYPLINLKNRFLFGSYGKDVYIEPGVIINRPRFVHIWAIVFGSNGIRTSTSTRETRTPKEGILFIGNDVIISPRGASSALATGSLSKIDVGIAPYVCIIDNSRKPGDVNRPIQRAGDGGRVMSTSGLIPGLPTMSVSCRT